MGTNSSFFFQPGIPSRVNPLTPDMNQKLTQKIGAFHVEAFNKLGPFIILKKITMIFTTEKGQPIPMLMEVLVFCSNKPAQGAIEESDNDFSAFLYDSESANRRIFYPKGCDITAFRNFKLF